MFLIIRVLVALPALAAAGELAPKYIVCLPLPRVTSTAAPESIVLENVTLSPVVVSPPPVKIFNVAPPFTASLTVILSLPAPVFTVVFVLATVFVIVTVSAPLAPSYVVFTPSFATAAIETLASPVTFLVLTCSTSVKLIASSLAPFTFVPLKLM